MTQSLRSMRFSIPLTLIIVVCLVSTLSCAKAEPVTTTVTVEGMHCQGCADAIIGALEGTEGITSATSDFSTGITTAVHDPKSVSDNVIKTTIEDLGYTVIISPQSD